MTKVIRSHPVVGSRKLQAPFQEGHESQQKARSTPKRGSSGKPELIEEVTVKEATKDTVERVTANGPTNLVVENVNTPLFDELRKQLDTEVSVRESLEKEVESLTAKLANIESVLVVEKEKGLALGQKEGLKIADQALANKVEELDALSVLFTNNLSEKIQDAEKLAVEMTFEALCKILGERYVENNVRIAIVENVISSLKDLSNLSVYVNPDDIKVLSVLGEKIGYQDIQFIADDRVTRGGCIVESSSGSWDGRLETQVQRLKETLVSFIKSEELNV
ncbi:hypothetical protein A9Q99_08205 [Gammaproteobacteria bacterium 45_16_T64]|nr:hypothetical protein A9Q99_08205 [Gammaproteobacteria bacterium 45_16_T64]